MQTITQPSRGAGSQYDDTTAGMAGPGVASVDAALGIYPTWWAGGLFTAVIGGLAATAALSLRRREEAPAAEEEPVEERRAA